MLFVKSKNKKNKNDYKGMSLQIAIALGGFVFSVLTAVISLAVKTGRTGEKIENLRAQTARLERELQEHEASARVKFSELYDSRRQHDSLLAELANKVSNLSGMCARIENKLDKLIEREINR